MGSSTPQQWATIVPVLAIKQDTLNNNPHIIATGSTNAPMAKLTTMPASRFCLIS
jgi:hypothetical protein